MLYLTHDETSYIDRPTICYMGIGKVPLPFNWGGSLLVVRLTIFSTDLENLWRRLGE